MIPFSRPDTIEDALAFWGHSVYSEDMNCTLHMYAIKLAQHLAQMRYDSQDAPSYGAMANKTMHLGGELAFRAVARDVMNEFNFHPLLDYSSTEHSVLLPKEIIRAIAQSLEAKLLFEMQELYRQSKINFLRFATYRVTMLCRQINPEPALFSALVNFQFAYEYAQLNA